VQIRKATHNDIDAIVALSAFVQKQHADALPDLFKAPSTSQQMCDVFRDFLADANSLVLVAGQERPAGYLWAQFQNRTESWARFGQRILYIQHMAVAPEFRRKGIGARLLDKAMKIARQEGTKRMELDVWSFNGDARRFYAKHGFAVCNEKMAFNTDGALRLDSSL
jgi:ribosomal protein S18 acetylase RimI-like enzyme